MSRHYIHSHGSRKRRCALCGSGHQVGVIEAHPSLCRPCAYERSKRSSPHDDFLARQLNKQHAQAREAAQLRSDRHVPDREVPEGRCPMHPSEPVLECQGCIELSERRWEERDIDVC